MSKEYRVVKHTSTEVLGAEMSVHLTAGWNPVGGVSAALLRYDRDGNHILEYAQAIEREYQDAPEEATVKVEVSKEVAIQGKFYSRKPRR